MFNFIDIYSFILVSGCVGLGPRTLLSRGHNAAKMALGQTTYQINMHLDLCSVWVYEMYFHGIKT